MNDTPSTFGYRVEHDIYYSLFGSYSHLSTRELEKKGGNLIMYRTLVRAMEPLSIADIAFSELRKRIEMLEDRPSPSSLVALQLPSGIIREHSRFSTYLRKELDCEVIVLLRPSYGACDIPYPYLVELGASLVIHLGHAPLGSMEESIPTLFIPIALPVDFDSMSEVLDRLVEENSLRGNYVALTTTVQYVGALKTLSKELQSRGAIPIIRSGTSRCSLPGPVLGCNFSAARVEKAAAVIFLGTGVFHPRGLAISTEKKVIALDPHTNTYRKIEAGGFLKKRASLALGLSNGKNFLVFFSPRPGQNRLELARELVIKSRENGYACELAMLDEIRPEYFIGIGVDAIVSTACPRIAYDDIGNYPIPVLTPSEFLLAIGEIDIDEFGIDELY